MKVLLSADSQAARSAKRGVSKAKPLVIRTMPFSFSQLLLWMLALAGAGALIYWIGIDRFRNWNEGGVFEISGLETGVLVFAVAALCWLATQCWKYFDPYPEVRISPGAAPLGSSFDVEWTFRGSKRRLQTIAMALEGREEVWAENKTSKLARAQKLTAPFYLEELDMLDRLHQGHVHVQVPEGLMPSMDAENTKIVWLVRFENQIKWGARMKYEFPVHVLPEVSDG